MNNLKAFIEEMPKCELHVHIEGAWLPRATKDRHITKLKTFAG